MKPTSKNKPTKTGPKPLNNLLPLTKQIIKMKTQNLILWTLRAVAAGIMLQTLYFKFTAQPESVYIFSSIGAEPFGRIASGIAELIASILLLIPSRSWMGALLGVGVMVGAIATHLLILGIEVMGDGGQLFYMALITFLSCGIILWFEKATALHFIQQIIK